MTFLQPDPPRSDWRGLDSLARFPDATVIIVDGLRAWEVARGVFAHNPCITLDGPVERLYAPALAGRKAIVWPDCNPDNDVALESMIRCDKMILALRDTCTELRQVIDCGQTIPAMTPRAILAWLRDKANTSLVHKPAVVSPAETPVVQEVRPAATVTPITEARTRQQAKPQPEAGHDYTPLSHDSLANAFSAANPDLRYVAAWGKWMEWSEADGWVEDTTLGVFDRARKLCVEQANAHQGLATPSAITATKSANTRAAVENLARSDRAHALPPEAWDADKYLLNTPGGIVDLRTGSLRPTRQDDYCRKRTTATPGGVCPQWDAFMRQTTGGDEELEAYLDRLGGLCLTGETKDHSLTFIYGTGGNGKGTFLDTVLGILGSYGLNVPSSTFMEQRNAEHPESVAQMMGARMVVANEVPQGKRWNESLITELTGGSVMRARFMHKSYFSFKPELKLIICGMHKPGLTLVTEGMKRRLALVPFTQKPPVPDPDLPAKLWAERDGILLRLLAGCADWMKQGLNPPESVRAATTNYFADQDILGQWIGDCCTDIGECGIGKLHKNYSTYCDAMREPALRQGELKDALLHRGYKLGGYASKPVIVGLSVRVDMSRQSSRTGSRDDD